MLRTSFAKRALALVTVCSLAFGAVALTGCSGSSDSSSSASSEASSSSTASSSAATSASKDIKTEGDMTGIHHAEMIVEGYDPITIELNADEAPISVSNFVDLAESGYYDGLTFYRIQDGFVLQGGTLGNTASGNDSTLTPIAGEFSQNGYDNALADDFGKGTVAMARTNDPDSATSTFFVTLDDGDMVGGSLNGLYAAFGTIDEAGMATIEKIVADHISAVDSTSQMGIIANESDMPVIEKVTIVD